jgi:hypothetical protein
MIVNWREQGEALSELSNASLVAFRVVIGDAEPTRFAAGGTAEL